MCIRDRLGTVAKHHQVTVYNELQFSEEKMYSNVLVSALIHKETQCRVNTGNQFVNLEIDFYFMLKIIILTTYYCST